MKYISRLLTPTIIVLLIGTNCDEMPKQAIITILDYDNTASGNMTDNIYVSNNPEPTSKKVTLDLYNGDYIDEPEGNPNVPGLHVYRQKNTYYEEDTDDTTVGGELVITAYGHHNGRSREYVRFKVEIVGFNYVEHGRGTYENPREYCGYSGSIYESNPRSDMQKPHAYDYGKYEFCSITSDDEDSLSIYYEED